MQELFKDNSLLLYLCLRGKNRKVIMAQILAPPLLLRV